MSSLGERSGMAMGKACEECSRRCSLLHGKGKNSEPSLSSFFKIMFGERFSEYLFFPPKFVPMVSGLVNQGTFLKDTNGGRWRVEFANVDGSLALGKGWGDFVKHHDLVLGDLVVFDLAESHLDVRMYGRTACEKLNVAEIVGKKQGANGNSCGESHDLNNGGSKCSETEQLKDQQSKAVKETGSEEANFKKNKQCSESSFQIPAAKDNVVGGQGLKPSNGTEKTNKWPRNDASAGAPIVIDLEVDEDEPKAASNERAGGCEKAKAALKMECGKSSENIHISRNEKNKRASDVELQQSKVKFRKKEKLNDTERNKNSNPQHLFNGECSRDAEMGKVQTKSAANEPQQVEATTTNRASAAAGNMNGKSQRSDVFEKKLQSKCGGDQSESTLMKYERGSSGGKNKVAATGKLKLELDKDFMERSKKLVSGFATENLSKRFSIPSTGKELERKAARTSRRLSGEGVELMQMKDDHRRRSMMETGMFPMAVLKSEPLCFDSSLPMPISAQISCVIPNQTRTHLDLSAPLPMLGGRLCFQRKVVILKDENGKLWPVLYHRPSATKVVLGSGWEAFADAHIIRAGDECIFSVDNCSEGVYAIHIIRHHVAELAS